MPYAGAGAAAMAAVVRWLLGHAVALEYSDSGKRVVRLGEFCVRECAIAVFLCVC